MKPTADVKSQRTALGSILVGLGMAFLFLPIVAFACLAYLVLDIFSDRDSGSGQNGYHRRFLTSGKHRRSGGRAAYS
jgi:hypothetical protein